MPSQTRQNFIEAVDLQIIEHCDHVAVWSRANVVAFFTPLGKTCGDVRECDVAMIDRPPSGSYNWEMSPPPYFTYPEDIITCNLEAEPNI